MDGLWIMNYGLWITYYGWMELLYRSFFYLSRRVKVVDVKGGIGRKEGLEYKLFYIIELLYFFSK